MLTRSNEHRSINYFQAELDLALYRIGAGDGTEVLVPEGCIAGRAEIRVIEGIEQLRSELEPEAFRYGEVLEDTEVGIVERRTFERIASQIAELIARSDLESSGI